MLDEQKINELVDESAAPVLWARAVKIRENFLTQRRRWALEVVCPHCPGLHHHPFEMSDKVQDVLGLQPALCWNPKSPFLKTGYALTAHP